ncbi:hypothetical protein [Haliangium sp.]|uniref:hypothetical protein n=1 Tax=Haliangium sp. TaxID=2663208 RepID=UPI003D0C0D2D
MSVRARLLRYGPWAALAVPGLIQVGLLLYTVALRLTYPFDLEWMEGGLLAHAARLAEGQSIYPPPSLAFIPYLYTPLYPALLAGLGGIFGLSYALGRAVSAAAVVAVLALTAVLLHRGLGGDDGDAERDPAAAEELADIRPIAWCGAALAAGVFAATYPWVEGWYDLVRADTLFLAMVLAGLAVLDAYARRPGRSGAVGVAGAAAILALSFFCKQTGIFYVAVGGVLVLVWGWRRVPIYVAVAGVIGLGGTAIFNGLTDGWFWTYVFEVHQAHDFNMDRFYLSFAHILGKFPLMSAAIAAGLATTAATALARRRQPAGARSFLVWSLAFAVSCVVGAIGWGTQWAHFNAYMPAMLTGGLAAGAALPALAAFVRRRRRSRPQARRLAWAVPMTAAALLGVQLIVDVPALGDGRLAWSLWSPARFIPSPRDEAAGEALIARLRELRAGGDIYVPFHPWYARLAGQTEVYTHRMGLMDLRYDNRWQVEGLSEAFRDRRFAAVILDNRPVGWEMPGLRASYRIDEVLPGTMRPRLYTGAKVVPETVWVPIEVAPPAGATALFDFETNHLRGWNSEGSAWGRRPVQRPLPKQGQVGGFRGRAYVTSMHGGDASTGRLRSPRFPITAARLRFRLSGGADPERLYVALEVGDEQVLRASPDVDGERMREVSWDLTAWRGQQARLVLVDEATGAWGHLNVDDFVLAEQ